MIATERLLLRPPAPGDRAALHAMWADPRVMAELGPVKSAAESDATIARHQGYRTPHGLGFWVTALRETDRAIGFCGLKPGAEDTPAAGEVEIGWMIAAEHWGHGYAREAAEASLGWAWANTPAARVVAITSARNAKSRALMQRLGMVHLPECDFGHPLYPPGDPLRASVLYAIVRPAERSVHPAASKRG